MTHGLEYYEATTSQKFTRCCTHTVFGITMRCLQAKVNEQRVYCHSCMFSTYTEIVPWFMGIYHGNTVVLFETTDPLYMNKVIIQCHFPSQVISIWYHHPTMSPRQYIFIREPKRSRSIWLGEKQKQCALKIIHRPYSFWSDVTKSYRKSLNIFFSSHYECASGFCILNFNFNNKRKPKQQKTRKIVQ